MAMLAEDRKKATLALCHRPGDPCCRPDILERLVKEKNGKALFIPSAEHSLEIAGDIEGSFSGLTGSVMAVQTFFHAAPQKGKCMGSRESRPERKRIYLVPGIDDTSKRMEFIRRNLNRAGYSDVHTIEIHPNDGSVSIEAMADQVQAQITARERQAGTVQEVDAIGYSMGGIVLRYLIQRLNGKDLFTKFISIAAPHHGTIMGYFRNGKGARQMCPASELLEDLARDENPWGRVRVFAFWTPFDLMILPATSAKLPGSISRTFFVLCHPCMVGSKRVFNEILQALE